MMLLRQAILEMATNQFVFISDRKKGLLPTVRHVFPASYHCHCTWHLGNNIRLRFGKKHVKKLDKLVYTITPNQFECCLARIIVDNEELDEYIRNTTDPQYYSKAFIQVKRYVAIDALHPINFPPLLFEFVFQ